MIAETLTARIEQLEKRARLEVTHDEFRGLTMGERYVNRERVVVLSELEEYNPRTGAIQWEPTEYFVTFDVYRAVE